MQQQIIYLAAGDTLTAVKDHMNAQNVKTPPPLVVGVATRLCLRLFAGSDGMAPLPLTEFEDVVSWQFVMDSDWDSSSTFKVVGDNDAIIVESIEENDNIYTQIAIPISNLRSEQLITWLGNVESKSGMNGEITGYNAAGEPVFIRQIKNFSIRNRLTGSGDPVDLPEEYLNADQVRALVITAAEECIPEISEGKWFIGGEDTGVAATGPQGDPSTVAIGTVVTGETADVTNSGTSTDAVLDFVLPKGDKGPAGTIAVGTVTTGLPGTEVIVHNSGTAEAAVLDFTIPRGSAFTIDASGTLAERTQYDAEPKGFAYLATDNGNIYIKNSDTSADWSDPIPFKGDKGDKGDSCTVTAGTITFSGTTYQVVNSGTASAAVFDFIFPENMTSTAENISITDAGNYFESANVEGALQELAAELNGVNELLQEI